jgi:Tfp pilus assembly protein PilX
VLKKRFFASPTFNDSVTVDVTKNNVFEISLNKISLKYIALNHQRERGIALVVGLILLLILTVLGLTAIRATSLQERMSANNQQQTVTFQAAEQGIRLMMAELRHFISPPGGLSCSTLLLCADQNLTGASITRVPVTNSYGTSTTATIASAGTGPSSGTSLDVSSPLAKCLYTITSTATQAGANATDTHIQGVSRDCPQNGN